MFSSDFPIMYQGGLHARPLGHMSQLGLTVDGKQMSATNPEMAEYESPQSSPDRVIRVASNTGDDDHDKRLVQYAKATIQSGDGPYRQIVHPMTPMPEHVASAVQNLETDPDWSPFVRLPNDRSNWWQHNREETMPQYQQEQDYSQRQPRPIDPKSVPGWWAPTKMAWADPNLISPGRRVSPGAKEWSAINDEKHEDGFDICPHCGDPMVPGEHPRDVCPNRGYLRIASINCPKCGTVLQGTAANCPNCGEILDDPDPDAAPGGHDNPREDYGDWQEHEAGYGPAQQVRERKENYPEQYCPKCLWHTNKDAQPGDTPQPCPRHGGQAQSSWHEAMQPLAPPNAPQQSPANPNAGGTRCPNCGTVNQPGAQMCAKCGAPLQLMTPAPQSGGQANAYSSPYTGKTVATGGLKSEMSKWHLADMAAQAPGMQSQPDTQQGNFNDHEQVNHMSPEQAVGHNNLVNIVVDKLNELTLQNPGTLPDATAIQNLTTWLVDKFGQSPESAQSILDAAMEQQRNLNGQLDAPPAQDPADAQPVQPNQPNQGDVVSDGQPQNNGAFSHVRTPSGHVGHVVETWEDMYGEKWAMVATANGFKESVYADELTEEEAPGTENALAELKDFYDSMEPVEASVASLQARMANVRILKQEIRRHMANPRLSLEERYALDQMDADASVEMLELTDAVPQVMQSEQSYLDDQPTYAPEMATDVQPTMFGVDELRVDEAPEPEWSNEALDALIPEEAEIMVSETAPEIRSNPAELEAVAASYVDVLTAGHDSEDRARHRARFVAAALTVAADYQTTDEPEHTDTTDYDGPAEGIFT